MKVLYTFFEIIVGILTYYERDQVLSGISRCKTLSEWVHHLEIHISGAVRNQFYLESKHYIPERFMTKINGMTSSLMANGLLNFYNSFAIFKQKCIQGDLIEENDDHQALKMEQLKRPMILVFGLWAVATIIFVVEAITFKWKNRRNRGQRPQNQNIALHSARF